MSMPQWQHRTPAGASARLQAADARAYAFRTSSSLLPWPLPDIRLSDSAAFDLRGTSSSLRPQPIKRLMNIIGVLPNFRTLALWAIPCCIRSQSQAISTKQHLCRHMLSTPTPCICSITRLNRLSSLDRQAHGHQRFPFGQHAVHIQRMSNVRIHATPEAAPTYPHAHSTIAIGAVQTSTGAPIRFAAPAPPGAPSAARPPLQPTTTRGS
ncbi:hypothetical protein CGZ88_1274 [Bifidobacterium anseris]|uniref:Uncharacterized protein n=1 Tax=Bifidobacterium anseris TaxID=2020963 RepID=A0A2N5IXV9_9BIFI|nr:hypothetical protein CGZ88_1274 [Bifidobacterium anseris]